MDNVRLRGIGKAYTLNTTAVESDWSREGKRDVSRMLKQHSRAQAWKNILKTLGSRFRVETGFFISWRARMKMAGVDRAVRARRFFLASLWRRTLAGLGSIGLVLIALPLFAAFEAHTVNVTATIENALAVDANLLQFGTVFPQEHLYQPLSVELSGSFLDQSRMDVVKYFIRQKPLCGITSLNGRELVEGGLRTAEVIVDPADTVMGHHLDCGEPPFSFDPAEYRYGPLPSLCPYLSKTDDKLPDNDGETRSFHKPFAIVDGELVWKDTPGRLEKAASDTLDRWDIDLAVPCFKGQCAQDWDRYVRLLNPQVVPNPEYYKQPQENEHKVFGCALWVEVSSVEPSARETRAAQYTLEGSPMQAATGEPLSAYFNSKFGATNNLDWIGLYLQNTGDQMFLEKHVTGGAASGTLSFAGVSAPGIYEFRYFLNDSYEFVKASNPITVVAVP